MGTIRRKLLLNLLKLFDLVLMVVAFGFATLVVSHASLASLEEVLAIRVKIQNFVIFTGLLFCWHMIFTMCGMYTSHRLSSRRDEVLDLAKAISIGTFVIFVGHYLFHIKLITPKFLVAFWASGVLVAMISRVIMRLFLAQVRLHGRNLRDMLIVGINARGVQFANKIKESPALGYRIVGFVDHDRPELEAFRSSGYKRVTDFEGLPSFLRKNVVDEVVIALPMRSMHEEASEVAALCEEQGILIRFASTLFDLKISRRRVEEVVDGDSLITHYTGSLEGWPVVIKRVIDIVGSALMLILLSPVLLLAAVLIKLTSKGPVMFVQQRLGLNKRHFGIYKFRTMVVDAEKRMKEIEHLNEVSGPVFKIKNDPRITPIGKFLRKTSIDELPQLLNVFKGDMSLVGPRPLPIRDYEGFSEDWQRRRFSIRPGITCLWQIGGRSSISFEKWMELDLQYIDKWSLWLDLEILVKTIPAVLKGSGAA
ncbi:MAG TPA: sugar transferase [Candidatus Solibacter sp.]|nr:sugar transferase [Candidatus Solibacter sp.]